MVKTFGQFPQIKMTIPNFRRCITHNSLYYYSLCMHFVYYLYTYERVLNCHKTFKLESIKNYWHVFK